MTVVLATVTEEVLDVAAHLAAVEDARHGATATFIGTVRDHDPAVDGAVTRLDYSAHPDATAFLARIAADLDDVDTRIAVSHRIGALAVGDIAIIVAVATPHRAEAFERCRELVERVKHELPVWKRQHSADGEAHWVGIA